MKIKSNSKYFGYLLIVIVVIGLALRLSGISFGLPNLIHPDEARIILDSMSMGQRMSLIPEDINYPLFYKYILLASYGLYFITGFIFGFFRDKTEFAIKFLLDPSSIVFLSRVVTAVIGSLSIVIAYYWGVLIGKSKKIGLVAALFIALEWQLIFESQYAVHQTLAAMTTLLAFLGMSLMCINKNTKLYLVGGLSLGIAVASHQTAVLLFPAAIYLLITDLIGERKNKKKVISRWALFWLAAVCVGALGNLNWIFRFKESLDFFLQGSGAAKVAFSSAQYFSYNIPSIVSWYLIETVKHNYFLGLLVVYAIIVSVLRRNRLSVLYLITCITYFIFFHNWAFRWMHLFVGLAGISMLFAAKEFFSIVKRFRLRGVGLAVIIICLAIPNVVSISKGNYQKQQPETRQIAEQWILQNIAAGTTIAIDWPAYSVSIPTSYPIMLRSKVARDYFDGSLSKEIKDKYLSSLDMEDKYDVLDMIDSRQEPVWPENMPDEAIKKAAKSTTMRDVYSYFNFKPIETLKDEGVEYIVTTSYTYGMFLTNDDTRKKFLMNYYLKDNVLPFANNTNDISTGTQHELLYYLVERGREYFLQLLDNKLPEIKLIKEFEPDGNLGPIVKIFKINK